MAASPLESTETAAPVTPPLTSSSSIRTVLPTSNGEEAIIYLAKEHIDSDTRKQVLHMGAHPFVRQVRVMPDCHAGNGCCVGFTCKLGERICPGIIGGDIGCGLSAHPVPLSLLSKRKSARRVLDAFHELVPMGMSNFKKGNRGVHEEPVVCDEQILAFLADAREQAIDCAHLFAEPGQPEPMVPRMDRAWLEERLAAWGLAWHDMLRYAGTLGGGNHFIEVDSDDAGTMAMLVVHSGSRCVGRVVCQHWMTKQAPIVMPADSAEGTSSLPPAAADAHESAATTAAGSSGARPAHALGEDDDDDDREVQFFDGKSALSKADSFLYMCDMLFAQQYADLNRRVMLANVINALGLDFTPSTVITTVHNYIDATDRIIRKGAIRASAGQRCLVALNMRDGVWLCDGKGNAEWNESGPHGCGRVLSRSRATGGGTRTDIERLVQKFREEMGTVESDSVRADTLDERPSAYRDPSIVRGAIGETIDIVCHLKTRISAKAGGGD